MAVNSFNAQNPPVTTKGDVFTFSTIPTRLGVGANNTVLTADSSTATGLKWATPASGGMTLLTSGTISSSPLNLTSISQDYKELVFFLWDYTSVSTNSCLFRLNNDSGSNYFASGVTTATTPTVSGINGNTSVDLNGNDYNGGTADNHAIIRIPNYTVGAYKIFTTQSIVTLNGGTTWATRFYSGGYKSTTAISQINIINPTSGSYELYGVK